MNRFIDFFDLSSGQLRFTVVLAAVAITLGAYLFVRTWVIPNRSGEPLPVFVVESEVNYTGLFMVDPNTSPADSLELLPGIGPALAERIIAYRKQKRFDRASDITEVSGIGPKLYERIKPYLKVQDNESFSNRP